LYGGFASLHAVVGRTFAALESGAELYRRGMRTGIAVDELYGLQRAFKAVGLSSEEVAPTVLKLQKAIGGYNEMGEPTKDFFGAMGVSAERLKKLRVGEQFEEIGRALARLNREEATAAASKLFSRYGAGDILQIARQIGVFRQAVAEGREVGATYARNAPLFARLAVDFERLRGKVGQFYLGVAAGAAPGLKAITEALGKIDLAGAGRKVGAYLALLGEGIKAGNFGELLGLSLQAGMEWSLNAFAEMLVGMSSLMASTLANDRLWSGFLGGGCSRWGNSATHFFAPLGTLET
jgi:hypothetical protein